MTGNYVMLSIKYGGTVYGTALLVQKDNKALIMSDINIRKKQVRSAWNGKPNDINGSKILGSVRQVM